MGWRIGEILVQKKWIDWDELQEALQNQKEARRLLGEILVDQKLVPKFYLYQALAEQHRMRFVDLPRIKINPCAVDLLPMEFAIQHGLIPIDLCAETLVIAIRDPCKLWPEADIRQLTGMIRLRAVLALPEAVQKAIRTEYNRVEHPQLIPI